MHFMQKVYIGETGRRLGDRVCKHLPDVDTRGTLVLCLHLSLCAFVACRKEKKTGLVTRHIPTVKRREPWSKVFTLQKTYDRQAISGCKKVNGENRKGTKNVLWCKSGHAKTPKNRVGTGEAKVPFYSVLLFCPTNQRCWGALYSGKVSYHSSIKQLRPGR